MEQQPRTARRIADQLVDALAQQRRLAVLQADLVTELVDLYTTVPDAGPSVVALPGAERLRPSGHDGTPLVAEFLPVELAPLLRTSVASASALIRDVMDLRERLPRTWSALHDGHLELWQARQIARETGAAELGVDAAGEVDERLAPSLGRLPWARVKRRLAGLITAADPALAAQRVQRAHAERFVRIRHEHDGVSSVIARIDTPGAVLLESAIDALARSAVPTTPVTVAGSRAQPVLEGIAGEAKEACPSSPAGAPSTRHERQELAMGAPAASANPTRPGAPIPGAWVGVEASRGASLDARRADALAALATPGEAGGVLPRPASTIVVHLAPGSPVARGEGDLGPLLADQVRALLQHHRVSVLPVIDLAEDPQVDSYEIPARIRRQVRVRDPFEVFPFSTTRSASCDLDHTHPYQTARPKNPARPGQTRASNLGPLSRLVHRAKTHGGWKVTQPAPGLFEWTSPLGYRYTVTRHGTTTHPTQGSRRAAIADIVHLLGDDRRWIIDLAA